MAAYAALRITGQVVITHADRTTPADAADLEPVWFFGGVGYVLLDDPRADRYRHTSGYTVEAVAAVPKAYRAAIDDLTDEDRHRVGLPMQGPGMPGRYIREPYL